MSDYAAELTKERAMKDRFMSSHPESPFLVGEIGGFAGLRYFPIDPKFRVEGVLERAEPPPEVFLRTNRDGQLTCRNVGVMKFRIGDEEFGLQVYHAGEQVGPSVFIPFRDRTCGTESYGPGRYLVFQLTEDDRYVVDFNMAFNPYCAYTDRYECGLPTADNDLPLAIRAGEMAWSADRPSVAVAPPRNRSGRAALPPAPPPNPRRARPSRAPRTRSVPAAATPRRTAGKPRRPRSTRSAGKPARRPRSRAR